MTQNIRKGGAGGGDVDKYERYYSEQDGSEKARLANYADVVNNYYDLSTSFYEYGWGESFHFSHRLRHESHQQSMARHEHYLALKLGIKPSDKVLDVGCGIGGPLREIALFSGASITGLNNNAYQVQRGKELNARVGHGVAERCSFLKADFMHMPVPDNSYDGAYAIEATCHAPDSVACFKEILRVLKPGACFAGYEWCSTDGYDASNEAHARIFHQIQLGNGLPTVRSTTQVLQALRDAGFEVEESADLSLSADIPWWQPLDPDRTSLASLLSLSGGDALTAFRTTRAGRFVTRNMVALLEALRLAPRGSSRVSAFLEQAADGLVAGGKAGIFTPMFFFLARKPALPTPTTP